MLTKVILNRAEIYICKLLAKKRYLSNRENNVPKSKIGKQSYEETEINGIGVEFAFAKGLNLYPDFSVTPRKGGVELISRKLARIDVKQTKYTNGKLIVTKNTKVTDADVYVLVVGKMPEFNLVGWAMSDQVIVNTNLKNLGYGDTYCVEQSALMPINQHQIFSCLLDESREPNKYS